jgi:hypothetical protein
MVLEIAVTGHPPRCRDVGEDAHRSVRGDPLAKGVCQHRVRDTAWAALSIAVAVGRAVPHLRDPAAFLKSMDRLAEIFVRRRDQLRVNNSRVIAPLSPWVAEVGCESPFYSTSSARGWPGHLRQHGSAPPRLHRYFLLGVARGRSNLSPRA